MAANATLDLFGFQTPLKGAGGNATADDIRHSLFAAAGPKSDAQLRSALELLGRHLDMPVADSHGLRSHLRRGICGLMSAREGKPMGSGLRQMIEVAHLLVNSSPEFCGAFARMLEIHGHDGILLVQGNQPGWWAAMKRQFVADAATKKWTLGEEMRPLVTFLFPELLSRSGADGGKG